jgi:2-dehydropantoate 2-reductase
MGAGSIGSFYGGLIASQGEDVVLISRKQHAEAIRKSNLRIIGSFINKEVNISAFHKIELVEKLLEEQKINFKYIFITTKAHQTENAAKQLSNLVSKNTTFISLQNGLETEKIIQNIYPENEVLRAITSIGVCRPDAGIVDYTGEGLTLLGYQNEKEYKIASELFSILKKTELDIKLESNIQGAVFSKVIVNCGLNPLTALYKVKNIEVYNQKKLRQLATKLAQEAWKVAEKLGVELLVDNPIDFMFDVIRNTGDNINSMLDDINHKRKTEIDFINGKIMELGIKIGVDVSTNQKIYNEIIKLTRDFT